MLRDARANRQMRFDAEMHRREQDDQIRNAIRDDLASRGYYNSNTRDYQKPYRESDAWPTLREIEAQERYGPQGAGETYECTYSPTVDERWEPAYNRLNGYPEKPARVRTKKAEGWDLWTEDSGLAKPAEVSRAAGRQKKGAPSRHEKNASRSLNEASLRPAKLLPRRPRTQP